MCASCEYPGQLRRKSSRRVADKKVLAGFNHALSVDCIAVVVGRAFGRFLGEPFMATQTVEAFPQRYARVGGVLYLAIIVLGAFAEGFVANKLLISGDAAATAHHILTSPGLWRLSVAGDLI